MWRSRRLQSVCKTKSIRSLSTKLPEEWSTKASKELKGKDPEKVLTIETPEGIRIKPLYTADDTKVCNDRSLIVIKSTVL